MEPKAAMGDLFPHRNRNSHRQRRIFEPIRLTIVEHPMEGAIYPISVPKHHA
jgi:hypothetical protein